jgi:hypothetical protein
MNVFKKIMYMELILMSCSIITLILSAIDIKLKKPFLPISVMGFAYAFSTGMYAGFLICKKMMKKS